MNLGAPLHSDGDVILPDRVASPALLHTTRPWGDLATGGSVARQPYPAGSRP